MSEQPRYRRAGGGISRVRDEHPGGKRALPDVRAPLILTTPDMKRRFDELYGDDDDGGGHRLDIVAVEGIAPFPRTLRGLVRRYG